MLAILSTHPIQYQVPIWQGLAARGDVPLKVFYLSRHGLDPSFDPGFGRSFAWDMDLLEGYPHQFLDAITGKKQGGFGWLRLRPGFGKMLRDQGVTVLWVQGWQVLAYWQAVREARQAGIAVWMRGDSNLRSGRGGVARRLKWTLLRLLLNRVDRFLTVGEANREFYLALGYKPAQMHPARHCVDNSRFRQQAEALRPSRAALRREFRIPENAFCILWVGKFVPKKRPLDLVRAVGRLQARPGGRPLHLLWVGTGELGGAIMESCNTVYSSDAGPGAIPAQPGLPDASFAGFLNQGRIAQAYVAADVLVLPSDGGETWGLVVNEAMACGLPCVVSRACGCAEDLVSAIRPDLVFPTGDIDALASSLASVMSNPPDPNSLRVLVDQYDVSRTVDSVAALYRSAR